MTHPLRSTLPWAFLMLLFVAGIRPVAAQDDEDERELGNFFEGELGAVWAAGNSLSNTFSASATFRRVRAKSELKLQAGGLRTESAVSSRRAVGTEAAYDLEDERDLELTAEAYYARGRYDYLFSRRFYAFGGIDWLRNTFAGIDSRFLFVVGAGNTWFDTDRLRFKTDYGFTYTLESEVFDNPFIDKATNFPGLRVGYDLFYQLSSTTEFNSSLVADWNLNNTDDIRLEWLNSLNVAISSRLALKPSLRLSWRNDPAFTEVPLFTEDGTPIIDPDGEQATVPAQLKELDSYFSLALVVNL
jgi:putative salt-induced outer membrane protein YdiY